MLGEDHSLLTDFAQHKDKITELINNDEQFAKDAKRYHELDKEIRKLELRDSPITDESMTQLKHERAELKDSIYHTLEGHN